MIEYREIVTRFKEDMQPTCRCAKRKEKEKEKEIQTERKEEVGNVACSCQLLFFQSDPKKILLFYISSVFKLCC